MKTTQKPKLELSIEIALHVLTWCYIFLSPFFFRRSDEPMDFERYLHGSIFPLTTCIAFYMNYFWFIPKYLLGNKIKWFVVANILMIVVYQSAVELQGVFLPPAAKDIQLLRKLQQNFPPKIYFVIRGILTYVFAVAAAVALHLSKRWRKSEQARAEAELGRSQAELKNLKNQINPHFLLNTLNNIYALTAFNREEAQSAILELSRMLRYMLYDNQTDRVSLNKEIDFLKSYISLMRLRILDNVDVQVDFDYPESENLPVAPLIFISLVENAFKHGISSGQPSFIHINLKANSEVLTFRCVNSNFPKNESDKAPGGIGLSQVAKRLELSYPGRYTWNYGHSPDGKTYYSEIILTDKNPNTPSL